MRIIAGLARGRRLFAPGARGGAAIRPTADRAREALFNILGQGAVSGATVLDLFAGTGALGLEALSRGAAEAFFVDHSPLALELIHKNIAACGFAERAHVIRHDLLKGLSFRAKGLMLPTAFDLVFLDPPYRQGLCPRLLTALQESGLVGVGAQIIYEDDSAAEQPGTVGSLRLCDRRAYGDTGFWFYECCPPSDEGSPSESATPPAPDPLG